MSHNYLKKRRLQYTYVVHKSGRKKTIRKSLNQRASDAIEVKGEREEISTESFVHSNMSSSKPTFLENIDIVSQEAQSQELTTNATKYEKAKSKRLENWSEICKILIERGLEKNTLNSSHCTDCGVQAVDLFRCIDCISWPVTCFSCLEKTHEKPHLHIFEKWMHGTYIGYGCPTPVWKNGRHVSCSTCYLKEIVVIDDKGRQHVRKIEFCSCEEEAVTLLWYDLWPSSPKHPRLAFHIELLRWLNGLLLECHVSVKGFCEALKARQPKLYKILVTKEGKEIYKLLMDETIQQFRQFAYQMDYPSENRSDLDDGCSCPACFETDTRIYCFDADFQLVRKSSSGQQWVAPKHQDRFFVEQKLVDDFMLNYDNQPVDKECSDFQAGNNIRSKAKNKKLSETAVFGATCRHDFPQKYFSLKHGERLGYAVFMIKLLLKNNKEKKMHVSYDIACMLKRHLQKTGSEEILNKVNFCLPIFHCYGHSMPCQVLYGPRRTENHGLTDGEGIERLWSYLGGFSTITKEMTPENRTDLLTDGLIYFGQKIKDKLGDTLVTKWKRTIRIEENSKASLEEILSTISDKEVTNDLILRWMEEEKATAKSNSSNNEFTLNKTDEYALNLQRYFKIRNEELEEKQEEELSRLFLRTGKKMLMFKKKNKSSRLHHCDEKYTSIIKTAKNRERKLGLFTIRQHVTERHYLVRLMRKYAKGQSVFNRLSKQLKSVTKKLQKSVEAYNKIGEPFDQLPKQISLDDVKDVDSHQFQCLGEHLHESGVPSAMKQEIIQLKCLLDRCREEKILLQQEMKSTVSWYKNQYKKVKDKLGCLIGSGQKSLLIREGMCLEMLLCKLTQQFKEYIGDSSVEIIFTDSVLTDDHKKMEELLSYLASVEDLSLNVEDIDSENFVESDDDEEEIVEDLIHV